MPQLANKVIIVSGATSGIGLAAAHLFAREGARLVLGARTRERLDALAGECADAGGSVVTVCGDVRDEATAQALVAAATETFGRLDGAFNNAGGDGAIGPVETLSLDDWRDAIDLNLTSAFLAAKHQVPALAAHGGAIVFTSSFVGTNIGFPGLAAYAAAKAGIGGLVRVVAAEQAANKVRVNAVLPGGIDTPANHANLPGAAPEVRGFIESLHAMKRLGEADEVAQAALFLLSDASSFITGTEMLVDGGLTIAKM